MGWRQVLVLYAVLGGLATVYWRLDRLPRQAAPVRAARERFLAVEPGELREIRMQRGGHALVSRLTGDRWVVVEPPEAPVPPDLIAAFASALAGAETIDVVSGANPDARTYGLDERAGRVEMVPRRGEPVVVTIGGTNPTGTAVYARGGRTPGIVLLGRNVRYYEDLIYQALPPAHVPAVDQGAPVGG
jgi:hypothetical protein